MKPLGMKIIKPKLKKVDQKENFNFQILIKTKEKKRIHKYCFDKGSNNNLSSFHIL